MYMTKAADGLLREILDLDEITHRAFLQQFKMKYTPKYD